MRTAPVLALAILAACSGGSPEGPSRCAADADCADANACSADTCDVASGACSHAYADAMAAVVLTGGTVASTRTIPTTSGGAYPLAYTFCPGGPDPLATPPLCTLEIDGGTGTYDWSSLAGDLATATGLVPVRVASLPVSYELLGVPGSVTFTVTGNGGCPGSAQTFVTVPVEVAVDLDAGAERGVRVTDVMVDATPVQDGVRACGSAEASLAALVVGFFGDQIGGALAELAVRGAEAQLCAAAPCAVGTDQGDGICRHASGACVARPRDTSGLILAPACLG